MFRITQFRREIAASTPPGAKRAPVLILLGGEPRMRPDIFEISRRAKAMGFYVGLSTNGTFIEPGTIAGARRPPARPWWWSACSRARASQGASHLARELHIW